MIIKLNPQKIRADDLILSSLIVIIIVLFLFFHLIFLMSLIVFPLSSLFLRSIYKLGRGLFIRRIDNSRRIKDIIYGIFGIPFSAFILYIIFSQPNITRAYIIYFLALTILVIGFAGIIKGSLIEAYSIKFRIINIIIGNITVIFTIFTFIFAEDLFLYNIIGFSILSFLNAFFRIGMYLSEYYLSFKDLKSRVIIRVLFQIITEIPIVEVKDEILEYIDV